MKTSSARAWFPLALVSMLLATAAVYAARPLLSYQAIDFGGGAVEVGIITAVFSAVSLAVAVPIGRIADRGYFRLANAAGVAITVMGCLVSVIATSLPLVYLSSAMLGVGQMLFLTAVQSMVPAWSARGLVDGRFGHVTLIASLGQGMGLALLPLVSEAPEVTDSTQLAMLAAAAVAALALPATLFAKRGVSTASLSVEHSDASVRGLLVRPGMRPAILSSLAVLTGMDILAAYLPLVGVQTGLSVTTVAVLLGLRTAASLAARVALPWILRLMELRPLLIAANVVPGIAMLSIPWIPVPTLAAVMVVCGLFWGVGQPITMSWVSRAATPQTRATAMSLRLAGNRAGQMIVPAGAGVIAGVAGLGAVFVVAGLLLVIASISTWGTTRPGSDGERALSSSG